MNKDEAGHKLLLSTQRAGKDFRIDAPWRLRCNTDMLIRLIRFAPLTLAFAVAGLLIPPLRAADSLRYEAQPGSKMKIDGTSTLHDWSVEGRIIGGFIELDSSFESGSTLKEGKIAAQAEATIPARSLKSGKKAMDTVMHDAMKAAAHPNIAYRLQSMAVKGSPAAGSPVEFDTTGILTVAGVTKTNSLIVKMEKLDGGKVKFSGSAGLKMTDFGIQPPSPTGTFGLIKTGDDVKITFEWLTAKASPKQ